MTESHQRAVGGWKYGRRELSEWTCEGSLKPVKRE